MQGSTARKINPLTSLRFFAAAGVVMIHVADALHLPVDPWKPLALNNGVSFFFVLSGFILTYVYGSLPQLDRGRFLLARLARIWPAHIAAILLYLALIPFSAWRGFTWAAWLSQLTLTHAWFLPNQHLLVFVGPSWSVSVEFAFYLSFLFLIPNWRRTWAWKLAAALLFVFITGVAATWLDSKDMSGEFPNAKGLMYFSPYGRIFEFVLGMAAATLWQRAAPRCRLGPGWGTVLEGAALLLVIDVLVHAKPWADRIAGVGMDHTALHVWLRCGGFSCGVFALFISVMALDLGILSRLLSCSLPVLLGEISYSIYLTHTTLLAFLVSHQRLLAVSSGWMGFAIYFLVVLAVSYLIWALIERPCRRFLVRFWPTPSNIMAVELPASMITPEGKTAEPPHRDVVLPSRRGVVIAAVFVAVAVIPAVLLMPDRRTGRIAMKPAPGSPYAGVLDVADSHNIAGWAWDSRNPTAPVKVEVYDGTKLLLTVEASVCRLDLVDYLGDTDHGFVCPTPAAVKDGRPHEVHVRFAGSALEVGHSPVWIQSGGKGRQ